MSASTLPTVPCPGCGEPIVWGHLERGERVALEVSTAGTLLVGARVGSTVHAGPTTTAAARAARLAGRTTYRDHAGSCAHRDKWATPAERRRASSTSGRARRR